jgi:tetratricopeptide (TPR) repeat protein
MIALRVVWTVTIHRMIRSAWNNTSGEIVTPSALAVLRLMANSIFGFTSTGEMQHRGSVLMLHQFRQEPHAASEHAEIALALCAEHGFAYYQAWATIMQGWALAEQGRRQEGIAQMQQGLPAFQATGGRLRLPYYLALLAEMYRHSGQVEKSLKCLAEAFADMQQTGEHYWEAKLHRLKGDLLLADATAAHPAAEACLHQALEVTRRQQAKSLELRAATSLARLWQSQGKRQEAHDLLAPVYHWSANLIADFGAFLDKSEPGEEPMLDDIQQAMRE